MKPKKLDDFREYSARFQSGRAVRHAKPISLDIQEEYDEDEKKTIPVYAFPKEASLDGSAPSWIHVKAHNDEWWFSREPILNMPELAKANGSSAVTMARCLEFTRMSDEAGIGSQVWDGSKLSSTLASSLDSGQNLSVFLPRDFAGKRRAEITVDGRPVQVSAKAFKGRAHVAVLVKGGLRSAVEARYEIQAGPGSR